MVDTLDTEAVLGTSLLSYDGIRMGTIGRVFAAESDVDQPVLVAVPFRGRRRSGKPSLWKIVPLEGSQADLKSGSVTVPYSAETVWSAPEFSLTPTHVAGDVARAVEKHYSISHGPSSIAPDFIERIDLEGEVEPHIETPASGSDVFEDDSPASHWCRAAQIVGIGVQLSGHSEVLEEWEEDRQVLQVPRVEPLASAVTGDDVESVCRIIEIPNAISRGGFASQEEERVSSLQLWREVKSNDRDIAQQAAATLICMSLLSSSEIVRIAAAANLAWIPNPYTPEVVEELARGCRSKAPSVRYLAADALHKLRPNHQALQVLVDKEQQGREVNPLPEYETLPHTSTIVHGTWAQRGAWWYPGSEFFEFLKTNVSSDLFHNIDKLYSWEGRWKRGSRTKASRELLTWARGNEIDYLDTVFAHSHGVNVALTAALLPDDALETKLLVAMHPARVRRSEQEWNLIFKNIGGVLAVRSRFDLVVLMDRAVRMFPPDSDKVYRFTIPVWFSHSPATKKQAWEASDNRLVHVTRQRRNMAENLFRQGATRPVSPDEAGPNPDREGQGAQRDELAGMEGQAGDSE
ncbi:HEAT repeat domain-containing protein [Streptomyces lunaelactis]|uniref:HEAT repeat domain-containing protein n=1 Tax=Streptomyces lunaelactis TaxID=1535768 RepID=UPI0015859568|nr:HEAT repeat domain-containing protein [Streptomyces lunaelactis]NUK71107.1 HEAT repeat domain-containing protein [Streptomyces lunaelactis]NUK79681.1 HEAT repeat domain-containing protein [Streptomyces lunaelactis]